MVTSQNDIAIKHSQNMASMNNNRQSVSDQIVTLLVESGITTFFGIPGGPVSPIFDSILRCPQAHLIESRHETTAAFAAASYFEETGMTAAIIVTAGPGATNAVTGITSAYLKRIPIVIICGDVAWATTGRRLIQDCGPNGINVESIYSSVTRKQIRIDQPKSACSHISLALETCKDELYPGPVLVVLPMHVATEPSVEISPIKGTAIPRPIAFQDKEILAKIAQLLMQSKKPLLVIGNGCRGMSKDLKQLLELISVPFVTTPQAKGIVSEDHPLSLRNGGLAASWWARKYINEGDEVDLCLALGTDLDDCATGPTKYVKSNTKLIHVDIDSIVFNRNFPAFLPILTELSSFISHLIFFLKDSPIHNDDWMTLLRTIKKHSPFDYADYDRDNADVIAPHRAIADLQNAMPVNTRYISDIGEHMLFALHYLTIREQESFHLHLNLGSMGSGIGGAFGLAIASKESPVVCICGDGGMQMVGMEILLAKKMNLPIVFAIFNDARYNMVYHGFKTLYGYDYDWEMPPVDFAMWANAMGIDAIAIKHPGELNKHMMAGHLSKQGPLVLDIMIDRDTRISGAGRNEHLQHMSITKTVAEK